MEPKPTVRSAMKWDLTSLHEAADRIGGHADVGCGAFYV